MLGQDPLRFLLADDAGAGKTIMTGLYVREMLLRGRIRRVPVVPPAGLVGNWERELRTLFRLQLRILSGADARTANPFRGTASDLVIVSIDTLMSERMFEALRDADVPPYDGVVFDEAHKLDATFESGRIRKTHRYPGSVTDFRFQCACVVNRTDFVGRGEYRAWIGGIGRRCGDVQGGGWHYQAVICMENWGHARAASSASRRSGVVAGGEALQAIQTDSTTALSVSSPAPR